MRPQERPRGVQSPVDDYPAAQHDSCSDAEAEERRQLLALLTGPRRRWWRRWFS
jgi:hypothetical protein